jgi:hypothetical protein
MLLLSMMISLPINVRTSLIFVWISSISLFFLVYLRTIKKEVPLGPLVSYYQYQWWLGSANTNWHPYLFYFCRISGLIFFLYRVLWWLTWSFFRNLEGQSPYSKIALIKRSLQRDTKSSRNKKRNEKMLLANKIRTDFGAMYQSWLINLTWFWEKPEPVPLRSPWGLTVFL